MALGFMCRIIDFFEFCSFLYATCHVTSVLRCGAIPFKHVGWVGAEALDIGPIILTLRNFLPCVCLFTLSWRTSHHYTAQCGANGNGPGVEDGCLVLRVLAQGEAMRVLAQGEAMRGRCTPQHRNSTNHSWQSTCCFWGVCHQTWKKFSCRLLSSLVSTTWCGYKLCHDSTNRQ